MTTFCTKCGAALNQDNEFCPMCGAPAQAPAAGPATPANYAPPAAQEAWQPPAAAPYASAPYNTPSPYTPSTSGGSSAVKIVLIIVAVFVGLGVLGACIFAFTIWRVSRAIHVEGGGDKVTIHAPGGGTISAGTSETFTSSELGVDPYPGATAGQGSMKMDLPTGSMHTGIFVTNDSKDKVIDFYKSKFGSGASTIETSSGAMITLTKSHDETIMVTVTKSDSEGKTQISIVHTKSNKTP